jgi:hypothetical protein
MNNNNSNEKRVLESLKNPNNCVNFNESSFVLNKLSHMNDDECHNDGKLGQNNNINDYMLSNYSSCNCKLSNVLDLSTQNQGVIIKDGYGISECKIDNDSEVRIGSVERHYKSDLQLFPRPYLTTPNIFKGEIKPNLESKLLSSIQSVKHKQMQNVDEKNIFTPLNKKLKSEIQDPKHIIPEYNSNSWLRGGIPSRQTVVDVDYFNRSVDNQYIQNLLKQKKSYLFNN